MFPTLSKMRKSAKGSWMTKYIFPRVCREIVVFLVRIFAILPTGIRLNLISSLSQQDDYNLRAITEDFMKPIIVKNFLNKANDEMDQIYSLDVNFYRENFHKFTFYYGTDDAWVPEECYYEMKDLFPQANVILCDENISHSFVIGHSQLMSKKLALWLENYL